MVFYTTIKKNEIMLQIGKWVKLEVIMLSEISQSHRNSIAFYLSIQHRNFFLKVMEVKERELET
jgi:hypothetical protein